METYHFEPFQNITRIVIQPVFSDLLVHILDFHEKTHGFDFILGNKYSVKGNDFVIVELDNPSINWKDNQFFKPNILLLNSYQENIQDIISSITPGGVLIYNESVTQLVEYAENSENFFRKIPFSNINFEKTESSIVIDTEIGNIPLATTDEKLITPTVGCKHICQQLGIMEEEFYDALISFK